MFRFCLAIFAVAALALPAQAQILIRARGASCNGSLTTACTGTPKAAPKAACTGAAPKAATCTGAVVAVRIHPLAKLRARLAKRHEHRADVLRSAPVRISIGATIQATAGRCAGGVCR